MMIFIDIHNPDYSPQNSQKTLSKLQRTFIFICQKQIRQSIMLTLIISVFICVNPWLMN